MRVDASNDRRTSKVRSPGTQGRLFQMANVKVCQIVNRLNSLGFKQMEKEFQGRYYDCVFGASSPMDNAHDELSFYILDELEHLLSNPGLIFELLPVLPSSLAAVSQQRATGNFDEDELLQLVSQEPAIAAKLLELANSSRYNPGNGDVSSLHSAFALLGAEQVASDVFRGIADKLVTQSTIYFRRYGAKLWQHSTRSATVARQLVAESAHRENADLAQVAALVSNLGDLLIYQLMINAFSVVHPECQPSAPLFKEIVKGNASNFTYFIARAWGLPERLLNVLALQVKVGCITDLEGIFAQEPLAGYVCEARILAKLEVMMDHGQADADYLQKAQTELLVSPEAKDYLATLMASCLMGALG